MQSGIQALLPIEGLFSWAILSPLLEEGGLVEEMDTSNHQRSGSNSGCPVQQPSPMEENGVVQKEGEEPCRSRKQVYSCLHSHLLEVLVSDASSKSSAGTHPVDIGVFERVSGQLNSLAEHQSTNCPAEELEGRMEEAINRLAQILQVCLSNKLLPPPSMSESPLIVQPACCVRLHVHVLHGGWSTRLPHPLVTVYMYCTCAYVCHQCVQCS